MWHLNGKKEKRTRNKWELVNQGERARKMIMYMCVCVDLCCFLSFRDKKKWKSTSMTWFFLREYDVVVAVLCYWFSFCRQKSKAKKIQNNYKISIQVRICLFVCRCFIWIHRRKAWEHLLVYTFQNQCMYSAIVLRFSLAVSYKWAVAAHTMTSAVVLYTFFFLTVSSSHSNIY